MRLLLVLLLGDQYSMNDDLELSIITEHETIAEVIAIIDEWNNGFENFISELESYKHDDLIQLAKENWWIYGAYSDELEGIAIYQWVNKETVNLHVCTFVNNRDWPKFYREKIIPEVAPHAKFQLILLSEAEQGQLKLFERYGYKFEWDNSIKSYKSLHKL